MDKLSVKFITWNIGESINKITDWDQEIQTWDIITPNEDIIFITLQESSSDYGNIFFHALNNKLKEYTIYYEGEGTLVPSMNYYVFGYLCIKDGVKVNRAPVVGNTYDKTIDSICIYKMYVCTKPSLGFGIIINNKRLIFVCSHLPMNSKDDNLGSLGYNERLDAVKLINKELIKNVSTAIGGYDTIIWGGDMNFRIQTDGIEQLDKALKEENDLKGYNEYNKNFNQTCRYVEYKEYDGSNYNEFVKNRKYDEKRNPSYCDRIIYKGNFVPTKYYSWPSGNSDNYPLSIAYSDHVPVVLEGYIETNMSGGGLDSYYRRKYYKYKKKYLKLKN